MFIYMYTFTTVNVHTLYPSWRHATQNPDAKNWQILRFFSHTLVLYRWVTVTSPTPARSAAKHPHPDLPQLHPPPPEPKATARPCPHRLAALPPTKPLLYTRQSWRKKRGRGRRGQSWRRSSPKRRSVHGANCKIMDQSMQLKHRTAKLQVFCSGMPWCPVQVRVFHLQ